MVTKGGLALRVVFLCVAGHVPLANLESPALPAMSLRSRIALIAALLITLVAAVTTVVETLASRQAVLEQVRVGGNSIATSLASAAAFAAEVPRQVEDEMGKQMRTQASLLASLVAIGEAAGISNEAICEQLNPIADAAGIELLATDSTGQTVIYTADAKDFTFSPDPTEQPQASAFYPLLKGETQSVIQEAQKRETDEKIFKYVGVGGIDKPRIVQVGMEASFLERLDQNLGLQRLLDQLVGGDVQEITILSSELTPLVTRSVSKDHSKDNLAALSDTDRGIVCDCILEQLPIGRLDINGYHVAAPIETANGSISGAVLVTISTKTASSVIWQQSLAGLIAACAIGIPGILAGVWLGRSIATPVGQAAAVAEAIASGDLTSQPHESGHNEVGRLLQAFSGMNSSLSQLIGRIQTAGARLSAVESDTTASLRQQEHVISRFDGSTTEIAAAVSQISATSNELLEATRHVRETAREAQLVADEGQTGVDRMTTSMKQLDESMHAFTRKLSAISQRAAGITTVVTTIAKVAEHTNLLSLNATIEAEKAGEAGRGFRIVAQEIRRLADQTALATKDIERLVNEMQAAVSSGTMEMDRFRNEVSGRVLTVAEIGNSLGRVVEPVAAVSNSLDQVHEGMQAQSQGAGQIRDAMENLRTAAGESSAANALFYASLDELRALITDLNTEAGRFKIRNSSLVEEPDTKSP